MITFFEFINKQQFDSKLLDQIGPVKIFLVNASKIRDSSQADDEFNHFATHYMFPKLVPDNELWISKDISPHERHFLISNGMAQYSAEFHGVKDRYDYGLTVEKHQRAIVDHIKYNPKIMKLPKDLYYKHYCDIVAEDTMHVFLVQGIVIRNLLKSTFIEGTNPEVTKFTPKNEIWIEKNLKEPGEKDITILHEYCELSLMRYKKMKYDEAHTIAAKVDWHHRGKWTKKDVESLTHKKVLEMAKKYV